MNILIAVAILLALILWYALAGRAWLKSKSWAQGFFAWVEPIEIALFKKSETILFARLLSGLGAILTVLTQLGEINLTPLMPFVPEKYQAVVNVAFNCLPLLITAVGWMVEKLRNRTTKPIELVAVPESATPPEVKEAIEVAEIAKVQAVEAVKEAKVA